MRAQAALSSELDRIANDVVNNFNVKVDRSGIFFFAVEAAKSSKQDISLISTGSTIGVILLLLLVFRSFRALILPLVSIGLGVGFAFLVTHLIYGNVHVLTIVFGASLIGIVIDYSLHYFYHGANYSKSSSSNERNALFRALALSLMTSVIGYAALSFSGLEALQKVAVFSCVGLFMAWLSVICLGDLALKKPLNTEQRIFPKAVGAVRMLVAKLPAPLWAGLAITTLITGLTIATMIKPFNDDPRVFFNAPAKLLESERRVAAVTSDYEPGRYVIINGESNTQIYQRYAELMEKVRTSQSLNENQFTSLLNWVPSISEQSKIYTEQAKLYGDKGAVSSLYRQLGRDEQANDIKAQYQQAANRVLTPGFAANMLNEQLPPLWSEMENRVVSFVLIRKGVQADELSLLTADMQGVNYVNTLEQTQMALAEQRLSASKLLLLAYALVALLMIVRFRTVRAAWLVTVPMSATAMLFIIAYLSGFTLNLFHIMALFLVLGFGMDYTIFTHEMRAHANITLQAILLSAITSLLSFGLLGLSAIPVVASFGLTLLIGNLFNLLGAFVYAHTQSYQAL